MEHGAPGNVLLEVLSRGVYDQDAWERTAAILSEITNHSAKENAPQLERATSSSLQRRGSNSAASLPDGLDNTNKHAGRIPHSAYMCTDARQTHINPLASQTQTLQKNEFLGPTQSPHSTHQQAVVARPNSSWNLHNAVADRKSVTDRKSVPDRLAQQPQQEQHSAARRSPQPSFNKLYNPKPQGAPPIVEPMAEGDWPAHIVVQCNGNLGKFMLGKQSMVCMCKLCQAKAAKADLPYTEMTPTEFERHSGNLLHVLHHCAAHLPLTEPLQLDGKLRKQVMLRC